MFGTSFYYHPPQEGGFDPSIAWTHNSEDPYDYTPSSPETFLAESENEEGPSEASNVWTFYLEEELVFSPLIAEEAPLDQIEKVPENGKGKEAAAIEEDPLQLTKGQPSQATTDEEYWQRVAAYRGETREQPSRYVAGLLDDPHLNKPSSLTILNRLHKRPVLDQTLRDLRRRGSVTINENAIYDITTKENPTEVLPETWTDEQKALYTYEKCIQALHTDDQLTENALKLSTQASLASLAKLMLLRYNNFFLNDPKLISCVNQKVEIDTHEEEIIRIYNHSYWFIASMEKPKVPIKYIKGSAQFIIGKGDLIAGKAGEARSFESYTQFFDTFEEAEACDGWPSRAENAVIYDQKVLLFPDYQEHLHPLTAAKLFDAWAVEKEQQAIGPEAIQSAIGSKHLPLKELRLFGHTFYSSDNALSSSPDQLESISASIHQMVKKPPQLIHKLFKLSFNKMRQFIAKEVAHPRFLKTSLLRYAACYDYRVTIENGESGEYKVEAMSKWCLLNYSDRNELPLPKICITLKGSVSEAELLATMPKAIDVTLSIRRE